MFDSSKPRCLTDRGTSCPSAAQIRPQERSLCGAEEIFTHSGSWGDISLIVRRQTGAEERENGQIVRRNAAWGG